MTKFNILLTQPKFTILPQLAYNLVVFGRHEATHEVKVFLNCIITCNAEPHLYYVSLLPLPRSASNGDIPPVDLETNMEKSADGTPKKVRKRGKHNLIKDYLVDYTSNSNLHGLKYIGEKERTFVEK